MTNPITFVLLVCALCAAILSAGTTCVILLGLASAVEIAFIVIAGVVDGPQS